MINKSKVALAAANNAGWCDAMLRAHGCRTDFQSHIWLSPDPAPAYYPNAVTLTGSADMEQQLATIAPLLEQARELGRPFAIKDSFRSLALLPLGCRQLFTADWLYLPASRIPSSPTLDDITWVEIRSDEGLLDWESAWRTATGNRGTGNSATMPGTGHRPTLFLPSLLTDTRVAVIAAYHQEQIVAGCIAYQSQEVQGYTNMFLPTKRSQILRAACIAEIARRCPDLPTVGYESDRNRRAMQACGFDIIGSLQIWQGDVEQIS